MRVNTRQQTERIAKKVGESPVPRRSPGGTLAEIIQGIYYDLYQVFKNKAEAIAIARKRRGCGNGTVGMFSWLVVAAIAGSFNVLLTIPIWVLVTRMQPDFHVKEKILILINTWQEAFGEPRARYPQFYAAYRKLLRVGVVFPQRTDNATPVFTPPQTHPLTSVPQNIRSTENRRDEPEYSGMPEFSSLSWL